MPAPCPRQVDPLVVRFVYERSGGHPLFALEFFREYRARGLVVEHKIPVAPAERPPASPEPETPEGSASAALESLRRHSGTKVT